MNKLDREAERIINKGYATLAAAVFEQAVIDASDQKSPVDVFLDAILWLGVHGQNYLSEIAGVNIGEEKYNQLLKDLLDGNCQNIGHKRIRQNQLQEV